MKYVPITCVKLHSEVIFKNYHDAKWKETLREKDFLKLSWWPRTVVLSCKEDHAWLSRGGSARTRSLHDTYAHAFIF